MYVLTCVIILWLLVYMLILELIMWSYEYTMLCTYYTTHISSLLSIRNIQMVVSKSQLWTCMIWIHKWAPSSKLLKNHPFLIHFFQTQTFSDFHLYFSCLGLHPFILDIVRILILRLLDFRKVIFYNNFYWIELLLLLFKIISFKNELFSCLIS